LLHTPAREDIGGTIRCALEVNVLDALGYSHGSQALFLAGAAALLLLFIGIHNAWDAVTYHVFVRSRGKE